MWTSPCAACKLCKRKCLPGCIFAPYFPADQLFKFACVKRVYGTHNVGKLLRELNPEDRGYAAMSLACDAAARVRDPVYGCVGRIYALHRRLRHMLLKLAIAKKRLAGYIGPAAYASASARAAFTSQLQPHFGGADEYSLSQSPSPRSATPVFLAVYIGPAAYAYASASARAAFTSQLQPHFGGADEYSLSQSSPPKSEISFSIDGPSHSLSQSPSPRSATPVANDESPQSQLWVMNKRQKLQIQVDE